MTTRNDAKNLPWRKNWEMSDKNNEKLILKNRGMKKKFKKGPVWSVESWSFCVETSCLISLAELSPLIEEKSSKWFFHLWTKKLLGSNDLIVERL